MDFYPYFVEEKFSRSFFEDTECLLESEFLKTPNLFEAVKSVRSAEGRCRLSLSKAKDVKCRCLVVGTDYWGSSVVATGVDDVEMEICGTVTFDEYRTESPIFELPRNEGHMFVNCFALPPFEAVKLARLLVETFAPESVILFTGLKRSLLYAETAHTVFKLRNQSAFDDTALTPLPAPTELPFESTFTSALMQVASGRSIACFCIVSTIESFADIYDLTSKSRAAVSWQKRPPRVTASEFKPRNLRAAFDDFVDTLTEAKSLRSQLPQSFVKTLLKKEFKIPSIEGPAGACVLLNGFSVKRPQLDEENDQSTDFMYM